MLFLCYNLLGLSHPQQEVAGHSRTAGEVDDVDNIFKKVEDLKEEFAAKEQIFIKKENDIKMKLQAELKSGN